MHVRPQSPKTSTPPFRESRWGRFPRAPSIVRNFDQRNAFESRPVVFWLHSVGSAVKHPLIINTANVYGLDHTIIESEADAFTTFALRAAATSSRVMRAGRAANGAQDSRLFRIK